MKTRGIDRVLWPVFERLPWLDMHLPDTLRRHAHYVGYHLRNALEVIAQKTPGVRASFERYGVEKLKRFRIYMDGLITRDVQ